MIWGQFARHSVFQGLLAGRSSKISNKSAEAARDVLVTCIVGHVFVDHRMFAVGDFRKDFLGDLQKYLHSF